MLERRILNGTTHIRTLLFTNCRQAAAVTQNVQYGIFFGATCERELTYIFTRVVYQSKSLQGWIPNNLKLYARAKNFLISYRQICGNAAHRGLSLR